MPIPGSLLNRRVITSQSRSMYPDLCTIQNKNESTEGSGQTIGGTPSDVAGMVCIPCRTSPIIRIRPTDGENRTPDVQSQEKRRTLTLFGYFPQIDPALQQAKITSASGVEFFPILGVEEDGDRQNTRLLLYKVKS